MRNRAVGNQLIPRLLPAQWVIHSLLNVASGVHTGHRAGCTFTHQRESVWIRDWMKGNLRRWLSLVGKKQWRCEDVVNSSAWSTFSIQAIVKRTQPSVWPESGPFTDPHLSQFWCKCAKYSSCKSTSTPEGKQSGSVEVWRCQAQGPEV